MALDHVETGRRRRQPGDPASRRAVTAEAGDHRGACAGRCAPPWRTGTPSMGARIFCTFMISSDGVFDDVANQFLLVVCKKLGVVGYVIGCSMLRKNI